MLMSLLKSSLIVLFFFPAAYTIEIDDVENLYQRILVKAEKVFSDKKLDLTVNSHLGVRNVDAIVSDGRLDNFASVGFSVPFYSKSDKIAMDKSKTEYIEKASKLVKDVRAGRRKIEALRNKMKMYEPILSDGGVSIVNEYTKCDEEIGFLDEEIKNNIRILEAMAKWEK